MYSDFHLKHGDRKRCCIPVPRIKGLPRPRIVNGVDVVDYQVSACLRLRGDKSGTVIPIEVDVERGCEWCFTIDSSTLTAGCKYELEFLVEWADEQGSDESTTYHQWIRPFDPETVFESSEGGVIWTYCGEEFGTMPEGSYTVDEVSEWLNEFLPDGVASMSTELGLVIVGPACDEAPTFQFGDDDPIKVPLADVIDGKPAGAAPAQYSCRFPEEDFLCVEVVESIK